MSAFIYKSMVEVSEDVQGQTEFAKGELRIGAVRSQFDTALRNYSKISFHLIFIDTLPWVYCDAEKTH